MKTKIKFFDIGLEEDIEEEIQDITEITEGKNCIIVRNKDDFCFETHEIKFIQ